MNAIIFLLSLITIGSAFAQDKGSYRYDCMPPRQAPVPTDSLPTRRLPIINIVSIVHYEWRDQTLVIRRFGQFKIKGSNIITAYGLNSDNPTIYGRYKKKGDTLILKCRKSIQHFNKLASNRREKVKMTQVYKYVISDDGRLQSSEYCFWRKEKN
jgi:hypothetical protein